MKNIDYICTSNMWISEYGIIFSDTAVIRYTYFSITTIQWLKNNSTVLYVAQSLKFQQIKFFRCHVHVHVDVYIKKDSKTPCTHMAGLSVTFF